MGAQQCRRLHEAKRASAEKVFEFFLENFASENVQQESSGVD